MDLTSPNSAASKAPIFLYWNSAKYLGFQDIYFTTETVVNCSFCHDPRFLRNQDECRCLRLVWLGETEYPQPDYNNCLDFMEEDTPIHGCQALQPYEKDFVKDLYKYDADYPELEEVDNFYAVDITSLTEPQVDEVEKNSEDFGVHPAIIQR